MFIVIDGIDGSGKGTQVNLVRDELEKLGKTVKVFDYPRYGHASCFLVEKYLNGAYGKEVSPKMASLLYAVDRFDSSAELRDALAENDYVIANRYVSSNMIHQASKIIDADAFQEFIDWVANLEYWICELPRPDKVIFLNIEPKTAQQLIENKPQRGYINSAQNGNKDIHEEDEKHLREAHKRALQLNEMFDYWVKIDCERFGQLLSINEVNTLIMREILG